MAESRGETPMAAVEGAKLSAAKHNPESQSSTNPNRRATDPYARWCDKKIPRGPTYVDYYFIFISVSCASI